MSKKQTHWLRSTVLACAITAIAASGVACQSDESSTAPSPEIVRSKRSPLGVANKPIVDSASGPVVADELLVRFSDAVPAASADWIARTAGGEVIFVAPHTGYAVVRFADAAAAAEGSTRLAATGLVGELTRNHVLHGESDGTSGTGIGTSPSVTIGAMQWNLYAMGIDPFGVRIGATGVKVAVLDTGIAYEDHVDAHGTYLRAPNLSAVTFLPGYDFINGDEHPNDDQRHGTHIAGVIAASSGVASTGPGASLMPVKVLDSGNSGSELALAEGIRYATDHGARVINMSLAFPPTYFPSRLLQEAIDHAAQHGVIMVAAAGNHGEDLVAYPAAFRDVIAVGASDLAASFVPGGAAAPWGTAPGALLRAPYSNRSFKVDVLAPGGTIAGDANGDGHPEAILAQTFAPGDPTAFGYYFYAGTSQAAAEVSGVVATMLAVNPGLDAFAVRAILLETATPVGGFMSIDAGRGSMRADLAIATAAQGDPRSGERARFNANVVVTLHDAATVTRARARVEILDASTGEPTPGVTVYGLFTGAAFGTASAVTDGAGVAEIWSEALAGNLVVAFQVDAVAQGSGATASFDRPRGFLRIESRSLERLSTFSQGIASGQAQGGASGGTGIGTSPSAPTVPGLGISIDPQNVPVTIAFDGSLFAGDGYRSTLLLPNFSWGLATAPMGVAVDEAWFVTTFTAASSRRLVSRGTGVSDSPLTFDDASFSVPPPATTVPSVPLIVLTFSSGTGIGTSPSIWDPTGTGIGTSPSGPTGTGIGTSPSRVIVDRIYSGIDVAVATDIDRVLTGVLSAGTGIGTSPSFVEDGPWTIPAATFDGISTLASSYGAFSGNAIAAPAASYGATLGAAVMPMAPVAPESDGPGVGYSPLP